MWTMRRLLACVLPVFAVAALQTRIHALDQDGFYPDLSPPLIQELQTQVAQMKQNPRGPYLRLRWFCRDGSVLPPQGTPCRERGGGVQHAEFSEAAKRMAEFGFHPGPILQALSFEKFADPATDYLLLKELVIQDYLFQIDDGWVLRRARYYRGARQIEDEERQGRRFLERLLSDPRWLESHYLLAAHLVQVVPHHQQTASDTARIRLLISRAADLDPRLQSLRIKIHAFPSQDDDAAVQQWLDDRRIDKELKQILEELHGLLEARYRRRNLEEILEVFRPGPGNSGQDCGGSAAITAEIEKLLTMAPGDARIRATAALSATVRRQAGRCSDGRYNLWLLNLNTALQESAFRELTAVAVRAETRWENLQDLPALFELAYGAGYLSARELAAQLRELDSLPAGQIPLLLYKRTLNYLTRSLEWSEGTARSTFGPVLQRYLLVEPKAAGYFDELIRSSNLFHLAERLGILQKDIHRLMWGSTPDVETEVPARMRGLNPGLAVGVLRVVDPIPFGWTPDPDGIYVIPETVSELRPVAGLVTLDAGNLLSHVQLLARSLQIPNASVPTDLVQQLRRWEGVEVLYAVSPLGRVLLKPVGELTESERQLMADAPAIPAARLEVDLSRVRLDRAAPIPLDALRATDSGVIVGPKAANLGELAHLFPGKVARGLALPFGLYHRHVQQPYQGQRSVWDEIQETSRQIRAWRREGLGESEINTRLLPRLARVREAITSLPLVPEDRDAIVQAVETALGSGLGRGVFVRSDTNVEDLADFSGAGLNLTVPNQRTLEDILESVKRLWASPFSERAYLWRSRVLEDLGIVLPSVLILESVACDISGVLITTDLETLETEGLTVAVAEGVGGAVQGESTETLVLRPDGTTRLLSQAKAPFRRVLDPEAGGIRLVPSSKAVELLTADHLAQLRDMADTIRRKMPGGDPGEIWDIEFGFIESQLWLFQVRPFVTERAGASSRIPLLLDQGWETQAASLVDLAALR